MLMKLPTIFLMSILFASTSCFAEAIQVSINEPDDIHLGMKVDLHGRDFVHRITVDKDKFLLVDQSQTDVRIRKDSTTNLNHFNALVAYNLYVNNSKKSPTRFLYVQCPITRHTYIDRSKVIKEKLIDGKKHTTTQVNTDTLKREFIDSGYYKFLSLPEERIPVLSDNFPMVGKVSQHFDIEFMCLQIDLVYAKYGVAEGNRGITLKKFGVLE